MKIIKIGTRGSPLALVQAKTVSEMLRKALPGYDTKIVTISTKGDRVLDTPLWKVGGKGLFVDEIEAGLLKGGTEADCDNKTSSDNVSIDIAVHSMKDLPGEIPKGLIIGAVPRRLDSTDWLIVIDKNGEDGVANSVESLPKGAVVGTSSLRRGAQLLMKRPDLKIVPMRGNVGTRLEKLKRGECDATILAAAGLIRLGLDDIPHVVLDPDEFIPAVGQGALAIEVGRHFRQEVKVIEHFESMVAVLAERSFVKTLGATCHSAVGGYAKVVDGRLTLKGRVLSPDGNEMIEGSESGEIALEGDVQKAKELAKEIGIVLAEELLDKGAGRLLDMVEGG
jgi:hydroxymethylbilane synthase